MKTYFCPVLLFFISCSSNPEAESKPQKEVEKTSSITPTPDSVLFKPNIATELGYGIREIFEDTRGNYWFGTDGNGVYKYDGKHLFHFTVKDGLDNNQIQSIRQDAMGNIWFGTGGYGVCKFDGIRFTIYTDFSIQPMISLSDKQWNSNPDDLWFNAGGGVYKVSGNALNFLALPASDADSGKEHTGEASLNLSAYAVYNTLKDKKGNLWIGTQSMGVCRYGASTDPNVNQFTWFIGDGLAGPAVRALYEDSKGNLWFGNNGSGLFKYDGKELVNITNQLGLGNPDFLQMKKQSTEGKPGTMARVWTVAEDRNGNIWVGTIDAGIWRYDPMASLKKGGTEWKNFTTAQGLPSNSINTIFLDKKGELWIGTNEKGVYHLKDEKFVKHYF